jgi:hypothetical protein
MEQFIRVCSPGLQNACGLAPRLGDRSWTKRRSVLSFLPQADPPLTALTPLLKCAAGMSVFHPKPTFVF